VGPVQTTVEVDFLFSVEALILNGLEFFSDPVALCAVGDVHEFDANLLAVSSLVSFQKLFQLPLLLLFQNCADLGNINEESSFEVLLSESIRLVVEEGGQLGLGEPELSAKGLVVLVHFLHLKRIDVGHKMTVSQKRAHKYGEFGRVLRSSDRILSVSSTDVGTTRLEEVEDLLEGSILARLSNGGRHVKSGGTFGATFDVGEVCVPRGVHTGGVLLPLSVHVVGVVGVGSVEEVVLDGEASRGSGEDVAGHSLVKSAGLHRLSGEVLEQKSCLRKHRILSTFLFL